jgi:tetratricopeptide (TPR) repeat protein
MASVPSIFYQTGEQTREITRAMEEYSKRQIEANLRGQALMTREIASSLGTGFGELNQTLQTGFNGMGEVTERGFSGVGRQIGAVGAVIERGFSDVERQIGVMGAVMNFGFASLNSTVEKAGQSICAELREISKTLNRPLQTQALELYAMAEEDYGKKLYEDARDKLRQSVDLHKSYYLSWFLLGKVYLFGEKGEFSVSVIDPDEAVNALTEAAKYAGAELQNNPEARMWAAEICFYLGLARYRKYYTLPGKGSAEDGQAAAYLDETLRIFDRSWEYSNNMLEARYLGAACKAAQGDVAGARAYMETVITADPLYAVKAAQDPAFA